MNEFRFLLVGTGNIASSYIKAVANVPGCRIAGIVSRSGKRPAGAPDTLPVFPSVSEAKIDFDAVILAVPNGCHAAYCMEAAKLGKHVFTEKTLALTREDMDSMIGVCREQKVQLGVAFQRRTSPDNIMVHDLLKQKAFGKVISCELSVSFWRPQSYYDNSSYRGNLVLDGGGPFVQQASHNIDLYVWFFGLPEKIHAFTGTFVHRMEGEDYGNAILRHADGMIGNIIASTASKPGFPARMTIHTEKGTVVLEGDRIVLWEIEGMENPTVCENMKLHCGASTNVVSETGGHEILLKDFADKCRNGGEVLVSGEDARPASELILRIYEAAAKDN